MLNMFAVSSQCFIGPRLRGLLDKAGGYPFKSSQCGQNGHDIRFLEVVLFQRMKRLV